MIINILLYILILIGLFTGIRLLITARQNNLPNLSWLGAQILSVSVIALFAPTEGNTLGNLSISIWLFVGGALVNQFLLLQFVHATFYKDRKSPLNIFLLIFIVAAAITIYGILNSESNYAQSIWVAAYIPSLLLVLGWQASSANQAQQAVENEMAVEDWIKSRYQLIFAYSIIFMVGSIASFFRITLVGGSAQTSLGTVLGLVTLIVRIIAVPMQFLVWVMPEGFRKWLNRNNQAHVEEREHKQALAVLHILSEAMCENTGLQSMLTGFAMRETVGKQIGTDDMVKIEAHIGRLGYNDWLTLLDDPDIRQKLTSVVDYNNADTAIRNAKLALSEKQSLFTMQAR